MGHVSETLVSDDLCTKNKPSNEDLVKDSEFIQNLLLSDEQDISFEMDYDENLPEKSSMSNEKFHYFGDECVINVADKCNYASNEDREKNILLNQEHSNQVTSLVTSPKLSLKRNRTELSPDRKYDKEKTGGLSIENGSKKIKLDQPMETAHCFEELQQNSTCTTPISSNKISERNNRKKFLELLDYSKSLMDETSEIEKKKIENRMIQQLNFAQQSYVNSEEFNSLLDTSFQKMIHDSSSTFIILVNIKKELKKHKYKSKEVIKNNKEKSEETKVLIKDSKEDSMTFCTSLSFKNNSTDRNDHNFSSNASNDSVMKDNFEEKNSDSQSVDSLFSSHTTLPKLDISVLSNCISDDLFKTSKSDSELASKSDQLIVLNNSSENSNRAIQITDIASSDFKDSVVENTFGSSAVASAVGLCSSNSKTSVKKCNEGKKFDISMPSTSGLLVCKSSICKNAICSVSRSDDVKRCNLIPDSSTSQKNSSASESFKHENTVKKLNFKPIASSSKQSDSSSSDEKEIRPVTAQDHRNAARIKKLEKVLADIDKAIKKCQQKELTLDDLDREDSVYIKESNYKRRFILVWKKLCQLQKKSSRTGRVVEKRFKYEGSRYKAINEAIQKLVDKKKAHEKFPDYSEVHEVLKQVNDNHHMGLSERDIFIESERVFKDVGLELQIRRCRDEEELFGCYLTDNINLVDDPAEHDEGLKKALIESNKKFEESINEVIDKYAEMQKYTSCKDENEAKGSDDEDEEEEEGNDKADCVNDMEDDPPLTAPNSPALSDGNRDAHRREDSDGDIVEIINDSDRSTDPNDDKMEECKKQGNSEKHFDGNLAVNRRKDSDDDIVEIRNDSDRSTDPNDDKMEDIHIETENSKKQFVNQLPAVKCSVVTDSINIADSDSSDDLPSIHELLGR